jgi:replicative DNA helicase
LSEARLPPQNLDAERAVLGSILIDPSKLVEVMTELRPTDFFLPAHQQVYEALLELAAAHRQADVLTVGDALRTKGNLPHLEGGESYLMTMANSVPTTENVSHYVAIVAEKARLRSYLTVMSEYSARGYGDYGDLDQYAEELEGHLFQIGQRRRSTTAGTAQEMAAEFIGLLESRQKNRRAVTGVPTGIHAFDHFTHGFQPEHLIILAARPGMGKTAWALNIAAHAAIDHKIPVMIFSLEMSRLDLFERLLAAEARIPLESIKTGEVSYPDWKDKVYPVSARVASAPLVIDDAGAPSILELSAKARRFRADPRYFPPGGSTLGLIVVDYLQLVRGSGKRKGENREQEVAEVSRLLKALAKATKLPIIALAQLNRDVEKRADPRPQLSDLRESGSIEQDADQIIFIHREDYFDRADAVPGKAELFLKKNRHGATGVKVASWQKTLTRFDNWASDDHYE